MKKFIQSFCDMHLADEYRISGIHLYLHFIECCLDEDGTYSDSSYEEKYNLIVALFKGWQFITVEKLRNKYLNWYFNIYIKDALFDMVLSHQLTPYEYFDAVKFGGEIAYNVVYHKMTITEAYSDAYVEFINK